MGAERLDETGWERLKQALRDGEPVGEVHHAWFAREYVRDIYLATNLDDASTALTSHHLEPGPRTEP